MPGHALISSYLSGLRRRLPAGLADEVSDGLLEAYQYHLARGQGADEAARAAVTDTGDLAQVVGEFTRQAPGRRTARALLAIGPVVGACWVAALVTTHAWAWPVPAAARLGFGAALLATIGVLAIAATSRRSYRRTRLTVLAGPGLIILDATLITAALLAAPVLSWPLAAAIAASLTRITLTVTALPRITAT
jgi:MFS family permease